MVLCSFFHDCTHKQHNLDTLFLSNFIECEVCKDNIHSSYIVSIDIIGIVYKINDTMFFAMQAWHAGKTKATTNVFLTADILVWTMTTSMCLVHVFAFPAALVIKD